VSDHHRMLPRPNGRTRDHVNKHFSDDDTHGGSMTGGPYARYAAGMPGMPMTSMTPGWKIMCLVLCVTLAGCDPAPWFAVP